MVGIKYRLWTHEEDQRLLELSAAGRSAISISAVLKRSVKSVRLHLCSLRAHGETVMPTAQALQTGGFSGAAPKSKTTRSI